jgi:hypothetical protein
LLAAAYGDEKARCVASIDQMMAVGDALGESSDIACLEDRFAAILDQHRLAFDHDDQFVFAVMPVALARPGSGLKADVTRTEIRQTSGRSKASIPAPGNGRIERRRIAGTIGFLDRIKIDFRHGAPLARPLS